MTRTALMLLVVGGVGCVDWFTEPPPPPPPAPEDAYLVWTDGQDGIQTAWLDASGAAISTHPGLSIAAGQTVWRLVESPQTVQVLDCECLVRQPDPYAKDKPPESCRVEQPLTAMTLRAVDGLSVALPVPELDPWISDPGLGFDVYGTIGPYVLLASSFSGYPCGAAHGFSSADFMVVDLDKPEAGPQPIDAVLSNAELAELAPEAADKARAILLSVEGGLDGLLDPEAPLSLTALQASWAPSGLELTVQLTGDACYACSDGMWSAYTRSHRLSLPQVPAAFQAHHGPPPAAVLSWRASNPTEARWGFSTINATPDTLASTRAKLK